MPTRFLTLVRLSVAITLSCAFLLTTSQQIHAQAYGVELHNSLMSSSGGMGGASIARPQDVVSAINGNPATLTQLRGTQVNFSGSWIGASQNLSHGGSVPGLQAFSGGSEWPGSMIGNIGLSQEFTALGLPATSGLAMVGTAGAGAEFRDEPASNGTTLGMSILYFKGGASVLLTDRLSLGANIGAGTSSMDAPFVGSGAMTVAYAIRGSLGLSYDVNPCTTLAGYYESKSHFQFSRAIQLLGIGPFLDVSIELPQTAGFGIANTSLMDGNLLLAFDVLYKNWADTDFFGAIYDDQWVGIFGTQLTRGRNKLRLGYAYTPNSMRQLVPPVAGGPQPGVAAIQYIQSLAPAIAPHRLSAGFGRCNVLPGVDFDFFAGTMLEASDTFGDSSVSIKSYWLGGGFTWRFRRGSGSCSGIPDEWCAR